MPARGDLVVAVAPTRRRIVLLTHDPAGDVCRALLATNELWQATDFDVIVRPDVSGTPYALLLQPELYGSIPIERISKKVGAIPVELVDALCESLGTDGESVQGYETGIPLQWDDPVLGPDPRRAFKERELDELCEVARFP